MSVFDLDAFLDGSPALDASGLPPAGALSRPRGLWWLLGLEAAAAAAAAALLLEDADEELRAFLARWVDEEASHREILGALVPALQIRAPGPGLRAAALCGPGAVLAWAALQEGLALAAYGELSAAEPDPGASGLLGRASRREARHFAFFYERAGHVLAGSRCQRAAAGALLRSWRPWGAFDEVFGAPSGRRALQRLDKNLARLPGLTGFARLEK